MTRYNSWERSKWDRQRAEQRAKEQKEIIDRKLAMFDDWRVVANKLADALRTLEETNPVKTAALAEYEQLVRRPW